MFFSVYYRLGTVLGTADTAAVQIDKVSALMVFVFQITWGYSTPGNKNSNGKGSEAGMSLAC